MQQGSGLAIRGDTRAGRGVHQAEVRRLRGDD